jgi:Secretion system C-terminal sorting domain
MKHLFSLFIACIVNTALWAQPEIIDLTTGASNGTPLAYGSNDDTWTVRLPNGSTIAPKVVMPYTFPNNSYPAWAVNNCGHWISPQSSANGGNVVKVDSGNYIYEATFNLCFIPQTARVEFNFLGADNEFLELSFNNNPYPLNFPGTDDDSPFVQNHTITFTSSHALIGQNKIAIKVRNRLGVGNPTASGMFICGRFYSSGFYAGPDITICSGQCVTIGPSPIPNTQYTWTNNATGQVLGSTAQITVCPTAPLTAYRLTTRNIHNPCVGSDIVRVFTVTNNPAFTVDNFCTPGAATFNIRAKPTVTNANQVAGFGEMYYIEKISGTYHNTSQGNNPNPSCWWVYPNNVYFWGYNNAPNVTCSSTPGSFSNSACYRITRGTWNAYCPWAQHSVVVCGCSVPAETERMIAHSQLDKKTPDLSYLKPQAADGKPKETVYPNPSNGRFTITTAAIGNGRIEVYSPSGKLLQRITIGKQTTTIVDLSGQPSGTYTAKIITGNKVVTEKLVLLQ